MWASIDWGRHWKARNFIQRRRRLLMAFVTSFPSQQQKKFPNAMQTFDICISNMNGRGFLIDFWLTFDFHYSIFGENPLETTPPLDFTRVHSLCSQSKCLPRYKSNILTWLIAFLEFQFPSSSTFLFRSMDSQIWTQEQNVANLM